MAFTDRYHKLNAEQRLAVDTIDGPVMVVAGPGTGKTELLSLRVANILKLSDVLANNILCLTYTEAGASNMRERLVGLIGIEAYKVAIHTFHSFALDISQRFREEFYEARQMNPADEVRQVETLVKILEKLPHGDALASRQDDSFVYLGSVKGRIDKLKKAGLTPAEFTQILHANATDYEQIERLVLPVFTNSISKKTREALPALLADLKNLPRQTMPISHSSLLDYTQLLIATLETSYHQALEADNTKALTAWKDDWLRKDPDTKELQLKDRYQWKRNLSLATVYADYQRLMKEAGYVDFDDMIMDLIQVLIKKPGLLAALQEQYQYILVDEFQDTNEAQMRIINLLADNPVNEGRPNLMVVGDDDQSIYKFQGAEINNVLQFQKAYPATRFISLNKNYRSTGAIVDFGQVIIKQGEERLDNHLPDLKKFLQAHNEQLVGGKIKLLNFDTAAHEYSYLVQEIKAQLKTGLPAQEIAVIARNHRQLQNLATQLTAAQIAVHYDKQRNVLEERHIQELITLARLVVSLGKQRLDYAEELLTEVVNYEFWGLERQTVWQLAITASGERRDQSKGRWLDAMLTSSDTRLAQMAQWLLMLSAKTETEPLMQILDELIGPATADEKFSSPFRRHYFNYHDYQLNPAGYLEFLGALNSFVGRIKSFIASESKPRLADLVRCVDLHEKHRLAITDTSPSVSGQGAINLLSAHGAKGLEFDTVFVINCQDKIWAKSQRSDLIAFPKNLPIDPAGENIDDYLRLFFVAITRAKRQLYLTSYQTEANGKEALQLPFIAQERFTDFAHQLDLERPELKMTELAQSLAVMSGLTESKITNDERALLKPVLDRYVMSVTHLNNFLNLLHGGPAKFFEQHLLRFPQAKNAFTSYGSAMHATMEAIYHQLKSNQSMPSPAEVQAYFAQLLTREKLSETDYQLYLGKGCEVWQLYLKQAGERLDSKHWIETDFRTQQVMIDEVMITGKIDKIAVNEEAKVMVVYDFKTGNPTRDWKGKDDKERIKLHGYKRQITFYKLLIENSRDYGQYQVHEGNLEYLSTDRRGELIMLKHLITDEDVARTRALIKAVNTKIKNLDFPDISAYEQSLDGVLNFENDLLEGRI